MNSFLEGHFCRWMRAYKDGRISSASVEDLRFNLNAATCDEQVAAVYCIINDLEPEEWVPKLCAAYREHALEFATVQDNIVLGES